MYNIYFEGVLALRRAGVVSAFPTVYSSRHQGKPEQATRITETNLDMTFTLTSLWPEVGQTLQPLVAARDKTVSKMVFRQCEIAPSTYPFSE